MWAHNPSSMPLLLPVFCLEPTTGRKDCCDSPEDGPVLMPFHLNSTFGDQLGYFPLWFYFKA